MITRLKGNFFYFVCLLVFFLIISVSILVLIFPYNWSNPYSLFKTTIWRILFSVLIVFFLLGIIFKKNNLVSSAKKLNKILKPFLFLSLFLLFSLISGLISSNIQSNLWGTPQRAGGVINLIFYFSFSLLCFFIIRGKDWNKILTFCLIVGFLAALMTFFQDKYRPGSIAGNPNFLSYYLLLLFFISLDLLVQSKDWKKRLLLFFSAFFFLFVILFITQTRSAFLGICFGLVWLVYSYLRIKNKQRIFVVISFVFLIIGFSLSFVPQDWVPFKSPKMELANSAVGRVLSIINEPLSKTIASRISVWDISISAIKEKPFFGFGPENYEIVFNKYYDSSFASFGNTLDGSGEYKRWWDKAHNWVFDIAVGSGIPALIFYILFFVFLFIELQKIKNPKFQLSAMIMMAGYISYLVALLFSFSSPDDYLILFLMIGYSFYLISVSKVENDVSFSGSADFLYKYRFFASFMIVIFAVYFIIFFNVKFLIINNKVNRVFENYSKGNYSEAITEAMKPNFSNSVMDTYSREKMAEILARFMEEKNMGTASEIIFARRIIFLSQDNIMSNPDSIKYWLYAGESVNSLIYRKILIDPNFFHSPEMISLVKEGNYYFENASELSPGKQEVYKEWAKLGIVARDYNLAQDKVDKCLKSDPFFGECYWISGIISGYKKDLKRLNYYLTLAKFNNYDIDSEISLSVLINMYLENGDYKNVIVECNNLIPKIKDKKEMIQIYKILEIAYKNIGNYPLAKEAENKIKELEQ